MQRGTNTNYYWLYCRNMLHKLVSFFTKYFQNDKVKNGPNSLEELLTQFDQPIQPKTTEQNIQHYIILQKMIKLEAEYQHSLPEQLYVGIYKIEDEKRVRIALVPCLTRPGVIYECFNRN